MNVLDARSFLGKRIRSEEVEYEVINVHSHGDATSLILKSNLPVDMSMVPKFVRKNSAKKGAKKCEDRRSSQSSHVNKSSRDAGLDLGVNSLLVDQCQIDTLQRKELTEERTKVRKMNEPAKSGIKEVFNFYVGFDAEWQEVGKDRKILTEQWSFRGMDGCMYVWLLVHTSKVRYTFAQVVSWLLGDSFKILHLDKIPYRIRLWITLFNGLADLSIFKDRKKIYRQSDSIRNKLVSLQLPIKIKVYDKNRHVASRIKLFLRDCSLLAPNNTKLAKLGDAIGIPKVDIPDEMKSRMEELMDDEPELFVTYAAQDAVITLSWIEYIRKVMGDFVPITIGSEGAKRIKEGIMAVLGTVKQSDFDSMWRGVEATVVGFEKDGTPITAKVPLPSASTIIYAATNAYYGGRNECFYFGFAPGIYYDYDLVSAYPNAMCLLEDVNFLAPVETFSGNLRDFNFDYTDYVFARVRFQFPSTTKFPCIPIRDSAGRGLIYALSGECWASAPELKVALSLCADIFTYELYRQPKYTDKRSLSVVESSLIKQRLAAKAKHGKGSVYEILLKELANSGYGKFGQGLSGKRSFSSREANMIEIGPSAITSAPHASMITSLVRAAVSEAMVKLDKLGFRIASVTTDGFLTNAPKEVMSIICDDGILKVFSDNLNRILGVNEVFELKHACDGVFCMKTRGQIGFKSYEGKQVPIAKAGFKPPKDKKEDVAYLAKIFLERDKNGLLNEFTGLPSIRECVLKDADYVGKHVKKRTYWDFDYKRIPDDRTVMECKIEIDGATYTHVFYDTLPWSSYKEFLKSAEPVRRRKEPVKKEKDVVRVMKMIRHLSSIHEEGRNVYVNLEKTYATSILRGIRQGILTAPWLEGLNGKEICARVGEVLEVPLTDDDWKNAQRKERSALALSGAEEILEKLGLVWNLKIPAEVKQNQ